MLHGGFNLECHQWHIMKRRNYFAFILNNHTNWCFFSLTSIGVNSRMQRVWRPVWFIGHHGYLEHAIVVHTKLYVPFRHSEFEIPLFFSCYLPRYMTLPSCINTNGRLYTWVLTFYITQLDLSCTRRPYEVSSACTAYFVVPLSAGILFVCTW